MKAITKNSMVFMLVITSIVSNAQDTIYFKNKSSIRAKINEVGITEIKYQRFDNLNGPDYTVLKNEIVFIKYFNGITDTIKSTLYSYDLINSTPIIKNNINEKINFIGNRMLYKGKGLNDKKLHMLINNCELTEAELQLNKEFKQLNIYKLKQRALAPGLFLGGALIHFYALDQTFSGNGQPVETIIVLPAFIVGAVLRIASHVVSSVNKNKTISKRAEIASMYNELNNNY